MAHYKIKRITSDGQNCMNCKALRAKVVIYSYCNYWHLSNEAVTCGSIHCFQTVKRNMMAEIDGSCCDREYAFIRESIKENMRLRLSS